MTEMNEVQALDAQIAQSDAEAALLKSRREALLAAERPSAIAKVLALISQYSLTRAECESPTWPTAKKRGPRSDAGIQRGPRKPKAAPSLVVSSAPAPLPAVAQRIAETA